MNNEYVYPCSKCLKPINEGEQVIGVGKFQGKLISLPGGTVDWQSELEVEVFHLDCVED